MKTFNVSFISREDLHSQVEAFKQFYPNAVIDTRSFVAADTEALRLDDRPLAPGSEADRVEMAIPYSE